MKFESFQQCPRCSGSGTVAVVNHLLLREARIATGLSLRRVAKRLHVTAPYISDIERGRRNATKTIVAFYEKLSK